MTILSYDRSVPVNGYTNKILRVRLDGDATSASIENVPAKMRLDFQGGRGYAVKILHDETTATTDPLGPDNILVLARGPMTGESRWPGGTKVVVAALSPATNGYGEASVGGESGARMKNSGFDAVCIAGKASKPSVLVVNGTAGTVSVEPCPGIVDALDLAKHYIDALGKDATGAFTIGVAGRKLVRFACINAVSFNGKLYIPRQAGRTGMGAVMGSKNLVAVVFVGKRNDLETIADKDALASAALDMRRVIAQNDKKQLGMAVKGTSGLVELVNAVDVLPIRNFAESNLKEAEGLYAARFLTDVFKTTVPCNPGCNLACGKLARARLADGREVEVDGPEYETIGMLGSNLGIFDAGFVAEANYLCDVLGLDTISTGYVIGFLMECFEKGLVAKDHLETLNPRFGNIAATRQLIHMVANREGIGDVLARGITGVVDHVANGDPAVKAEIEQFAIHAKGLEISAYIPRVSIAQQVAYGTSLIGAHHREAWLIFIDAIRNEIPEFHQKADILKWFQNMRTWVDMAGFCKLQWIDVRNPASDGPKNLATVELYIKAINAVTGLDFTLDDHFMVAERAYNVAKLINIRRGLGRAQDHLPARAMGKVTMEEYDRLLDKYYEMRGWDANGVPLPETLRVLGLAR